MRTLKLSVEAMGAWPMYQLLPASPVRPQIFLSSPPVRTYTFSEPTPCPYLRRTGGQRLVFEAVSSI